MREISRTFGGPSYGCSHQTPRAQASLDVLGGVGQGGVTASAPRGTTPR